MKTKHRLLTTLLVGTIAVMCRGGEAPPADLLASADAAYAKGKAEPSAWTNEIVFTEEGRFPMRARWTFHVADPSPWVCVELGKPIHVHDWRLNGEEISVPIPKMGYERIPAIPAALLRKGVNVLEARWEAEVRRREDRFAPATASLQVRLAPLSASDTDFETGPILGPAGTDFLTVSCRTRLACAVTLEADGKRAVSPPGVSHTVRLEGLSPATAYSYRLTAELPGGAASKTIGPFVTRTLPARAPLSFVAMGDSRTKSHDWAAVASAAWKAEPAFVVFTGDLVASGRNYWLWNREYFDPARDLLAHVPMFAVPGNHDEDSPVFYNFFGVHPPAENWARTIGPVLLIGIQGDRNWTDKGENLKWLETVLAASRDPFIIFATHYPSWTSSSRGRLREGVVVDRVVSEGRRYILPLLARYRATAMIAGHDHFYERSEPPEGVSVIISGGAGAPLYDKDADAASFNPYSKAFARKNHYCLFEVDENECRMSVFAVDGAQIDSRTWKARKGY